MNQQAEYLCQRPFVPKLLLGDTHPPDRVLDQTTKVCNGSPVSATLYQSDILSFVQSRDPEGLDQCHTCDFIACEICHWSMKGCGYGSPKNSKFVQCSYAASFATNRQCL